MRIFAPLAHDHPLVTDGYACPLCGFRFEAGDRTVLAPARRPTHRVENVVSTPVHACCALNGKFTAMGRILLIRNGVDVSLPVVTDLGEYTVEEVGLE